MSETAPGPVDVVVGLGASAGGIEPLCTILGGLKPDLRAAVLVVVHLHAAAPSVLDRILGRCTAMPVSFAVDGAPLVAGRVYVAPADVHLTVRDGRLALDRGPTVNAVRPSVDVLFRSMAAELGARSVGVVLSGSRDDGAAGLSAIKRAGGYAIVQDPHEAVFPGMPASACALAAPDDVVAAPKIAELVGSVVDRLSRRHGVEPADPGEDPPATEGGSPRHPAGRPSELTCPECGGVLWEEPGEPLSFRCRTGHAYSPGSLVGRHSQKLEEVLWSAVAALEERADLLRRIGRRHAGAGSTGARVRYEVEAEAAIRDAHALRSVVVSLENPPSPTE